jgi:hypothetical protein
MRYYPGIILVGEENHEKPVRTADVPAKRDSN